MVNWDAPDIKEFKEQARNSQQEYFDLLGDREWDVVESWEWTFLRRKVGFGMYGPPGSEPSSENRNTGYTKEQLEQIEKVCDQLVENLNFKNRNIHFACIFVTGKIFDARFTVPVFKAKRENDSSSSCVYVDTGARKYSSWSDYLSNNTLPKCIYCFPASGYYECDSNGKVCVKFGTSPACDFISRVFSFFDGVATVVTLGATVVGVAALCTIPVAGPVISATAVAGLSTSAYGVTRSTYALVDRVTHSQTIGLGDAEARGCWLAIIGSSLGFAQGRMIASMTNAAKAGEVMGKAGRIAFLVVQTGSLTVNGIGIVYGLAVLVDKSERNALTALDVFQFSASLLFFTNAAINFKTASTIIKNVQHDVINSHREGLTKDARKLFNKHTGKLRGPHEMHGNAKVVKQLNRIENSKDLYEMMVDKNVQNHKVKLTPEGYKGLLEVNKNLKVHPLKLFEITPEHRQSIFDATKNFSNGSIPKDDFHKQMKTICKKYQIKFESMRQDTLDMMCKLYDVNKVSDIQIAGRKIFANATPHEVDRLRVVLENTLDGNKEFIDMASKFAESRGCNSTKDFLNYAEFFMADMTENTNKYEAQYKQDLKAARIEQPKLNIEKFNESRGIPRNASPRKFFRQKVLDEYRQSNDEGYQKLNERFENLRSDVSAINQKITPPFSSDNAATYHYLKHKDFGGKDLTIEQYFKLGEEVVGTPTNKTNAMLSQDGSCTIINYVQPQNGVSAIVINRDGNSIIATVMYDKNLLQK